MIEKPQFEHAVHPSAAAVRQIEATHEYTDDIHAQYLGMLNILDQLYYRNGHSSYPQVRTRQTVFSLAQAMPSLAVLDPDRTREICYNLNVCGITMDMPLLTFILDGFNSDTIRTAQTALILGLYRLVSGRTLHDERFHECVDLLRRRMLFNENSAQQLFGLDTTGGIYQILPNLWALMAFRLHDRFFGTGYSGCEETVLAWIEQELYDTDTGLYREFYKTGAFGIPDEKLNRNAFWHTTALCAHVNALAISYMHYFRPEQAERAWAAFKERFLDGVLSLRTEDIAQGTGTSYLTQLAPKTEALYGTLLCSREMGDDETYEQVLTHIFDVTAPDLREGKLFLDAVEEEKLQAHYLLFARVHVGWETLMNYPWENYYSRDYSKVR